MNLVSSSYVNRYGLAQMYYMLMSFVELNRQQQLVVQQTNQEPTTSVAVEKFGRQAMRPPRTISRNLSGSQNMIVMLGTSTLTKVESRLCYRRMHAQACLNGGRLFILRLTKMVRAGVRWQ